jgi:hypothetical protein
MSTSTDDHDDDMNAATTTNTAATWLRDYQKIKRRLRSLQVPGGKRWKFPMY